MSHVATGLAAWGRGAAGLAGATLASTSSTSTSSSSSASASSSPGSSPAPAPAPRRATATWSVPARPLPHVPAARARALAPAGPAKPPPAAARNAGEGELCARRLSESPTSTLDLFRRTGGGPSLADLFSERARRAGAREEEQESVGSEPAAVALEVASSAASFRASSEAPSVALGRPTRKKLLRAAGAMMLPLACQALGALVGDRKLSRGGRRLAVWRPGQQSLGQLGRPRPSAGELQLAEIGQAGACRLSSFCDLGDGGRRR